MAIYSDHILVAEDNSTNRRILQHMLSKLNVSVDYVDNGIDAVEQAAATRYACILMDMMMPLKDGLQATSEIRQIEANLDYKTPIIALTANVDPSYERKCKEAGMDAFLAKPFTFDQLSNLLYRVLSKSSIQTESSAVNKAILSTFVRTMGEDDHAFLKELFSEFLTQANTVRTEIHAGLLAQDGDQIAREVHSLRGSASVIGAENLSAMCLEIEGHALRDAFDEVELRLSRFEGSINEVRRELDRFTSHMSIRSL